MQLAGNLVEGRLDLDDPGNGNDTVTRDGRAYHVISLGPIIPYLPLVPFPALEGAARTLVSASVGIAAAGLAFPLARRYGPGGPATYWLATLGAVGTLLLPLAVARSYYYLAHLEAMLLTFAALIEWRGRRRPWLVGAGLGLAALARPTVILATIPFGIALLVERRDRIRNVLAYAAPIGAVVAVMGLYNLGRFGSPFETGYAHAHLTSTILAERRAMGLFSLAHVRDNLERLLFRGFDLRPEWPNLVPDVFGHSVFVTTPALALAAGAGLRDRTTWPLWAAAVLVFVPLALYYGGGGYATYGYRYFLDVTPFLLALVALAARRHFGVLEKALIALSVGFCVYGVIWLAQ
jgi:hypothetical protein